MKRILFVDDERRIIEALERTLRPCRKKWDMTFAVSGAEALAILAASPYDVIVTDMRMPDMDGAQLLKQVRDIYPGIVRIVLSGQFEIDAAVRAVPVAHQFLTKPCDIRVLQEVLERSCDCAFMPDSATRRVIAAIGELPALPATYTALMAAIDDPAASLSQVSAIVEHDVAVSAKILQLVNSAFFGFSHEIATIPMAIGCLGFDVLRQLLVVAELFRAFDGGRRIPGFSAKEIQRHSRCVALIAARLPVAPKDAAATSVAALLHDVGKLVLAVRLPEQFERALAASRLENRPLYIVEEELTGTSHAELGAYLLGLWGLPSSVVAAVSRHHHPVVDAGGGTIDISLAIHLADLLEHQATAPGHPWKDSTPFEESLPEWQSMAAEIVQKETQCR